MTIQTVYGARLKRSVLHNPVPQFIITIAKAAHENDRQTSQTPLHLDLAIAVPSFTLKTRSFNEPFLYEIASILSRTGSWNFNISYFSAYFISH